MQRLNQASSLSLIGAIVFLGIAVWWTTPHTVELKLHVGRGALTCSAEGAMPAADAWLQLPDSSEDFEVDAASVLVLDAQGVAIPSRIRRRGNGSAVLDVAEAREGESLLTYQLVPRRFTRSAAEVIRSPGVISQGFGVVAIESVIPRSIRASERVSEPTISGADGMYWERIKTEDAEILAWADEEFIVEHKFGTRLVLDKGLAARDVERVRDAVALIAELGMPTSIPLVIVSDAGRSPRGAAFVVNGASVVCQAPFPAPEESQALESALWTASWGSEEPESIVRSLDELVRAYGAGHVGALLAVRNDELAVEALESRAVLRYWKTLRDIRVRPIATRPARKAPWADILPGMLAIARRSLGMSPDRFAVLCSTTLIVAENGESPFAVAVFEDRLLTQLFRDGAVFGVETEMAFFGGVGRMLYSDVQELSVVTDLPSGFQVFVPVAHQDGYLETCGCKAKQVGGLARRATVLEEWTSKGAIALDCGMFLAGGHWDDLDSLEHAAVRAHLDGMEISPYDAIVPGPSELALGVEHLIEEICERPNFPITCANLFDSRRQRVFPSYQDISRKGVRVAAIGWLGLDSPGTPRSAVAVGIGNYSLKQDPFLLASIVDEVAQWADRVVVFGSITHSFLHEYPEMLEGVHAVITMDGYYVSERHFDANDRWRAGQRLEPYRIEQTVVASAIGGGGLVSLFGFGRDAFSEVWSTAEVLDDSVADDPGVRKVIDDLSNLSERAFATVVHQLPDGQEFVGAQRCESCHEGYVADWSRTAHGQAMETLVAVRRDRHPACVPCHVTGFGYERGFVEQGRRAQLRDVQCEVCHGPGGAHVVSAAAFDIVRRPSQDLCLSCHDAEHSDQFAGRFGEAFHAVSHYSMQPLSPDDERAIGAGEK